MAIVDKFVKNVGYEMKKSDGNPFDNIALEQTLRKPEEVDTFGGEMDIIEDEEFINLDRFRFRFRFIAKTYKELLKTSANYTG